MIRGRSDVERRRLGGSVTEVPHVLEPSTAVAAALLEKTGLAGAGSILIVTTAVPIPAPLVPRAQGRAKEGAQRSLPRGASPLASSG